MLNNFGETQANGKDFFWNGLQRFSSGYLISATTPVPSPKSHRLQGSMLEAPQNKKSLPDLAVKQGQIGGWEFATLSFPCWHLAHIGCQLPDAILHGKRSYRPHSRAVQRL